MGRKIQKLRSHGSFLHEQCVQNTACPFKVAANPCIHMDYDNALITFSHLKIGSGEGCERECFVRAESPTCPNVRYGCDEVHFSSFFQPSGLRANPWWKTPRSWAFYVHFQSSCSFTDLESLRDAGFSQFRLTSCYVNRGLCLVLLNYRIWSIIIAAGNIDLLKNQTGAACVCWGSDMVLGRELGLSRPCPCPPRCHAWVSSLMVPPLLFLCISIRDISVSPYQSCCIALKAGASCIISFFPGSLTSPSN